MYLSLTVFLSQIPKWKYTTPSPLFLISVYFDYCYAAAAAAHPKGCNEAYSKIPSSGSYHSEEQKKTAQDVIAHFLPPKEGLLHARHENAIDK